MHQSRTRTLGCQVVGLRTDNFNFRSQRAIEALGARKDGVIRHHHMRPDGSVRDSVMYSILAAEWPDVRKHLLGRLAREALGPGATARDMVAAVYEGFGTAAERIAPFLEANVTPFRSERWTAYPAVAPVA